MKFDIVRWFLSQKSMKFENEDEAFEYLSAYGAGNKIFNELCIEGLYDIKDGQDQNLLDKIGYDYARRHLILPNKLINSRAYIALVDPFDVDLVDSIRSKIGLDIAILLAKRDDVLKFFQYFSQKEYFVSEEVFQQSHEKKSNNSEVPVERLFEYFIKHAIRWRASDLHFENNTEGMRIRGRVDGKLFTIQQVDQRLAHAIISNIKLRASLKLDEARLPQDGRLKMLIDDREYDIRVSIVPTIYGENAALRIFNTTEVDFSLENIGLNNEQLKCFKSLANIENGLILVAGPTGSGKTTTLYSLLKYISSPIKKIVTIEDPIEYELKYVNQVAVDEKIGLTFNRVIRSILRQAPNVIFIGEIRDSDTARSAIQAALTGHLVLSSVHTGSSEEVITRLHDLGISHYLIDTCVRCIISQRLVRLKCDCSNKKTVCKKCFGRGYRGRMGVFEILMNKELFPTLQNSNLENFGYFCKFQNEILKLAKQNILFENDAIY